jgi:hypothetical protein
LTTGGTNFYDIATNGTSYIASTNNIYTGDYYLSTNNGNTWTLHNLPVPVENRTWNIVGTISKYYMWPINPLYPPQSFPVYESIDGITWITKTINREGNPLDGQDFLNPGGVVNNIPLIPNSINQGVYPFATFQINYSVDTGNTFKVDLRNVGIDFKTGKGLKVNGVNPMVAIRIFGDAAAKTTIYNYSINL